MTSELPATAGMLASGQPLSAVSPEATERPAWASAVPGPLQVAWTSTPANNWSTVYVSAFANGNWTSTPLATPAQVSTGASREGPISIIAPTSGTLSVLFDSANGAPFASTWNFGAPSYTLAAIPPTVSFDQSSVTMEPAEGETESTQVTVSVRGIPGQTLTPTATNLPAGMTASFSPASFTMPGQTTMTLINASAPLQTFNAIVGGTTPAGGAIEPSALSVTLAACVPYTNVCPANSCGGEDNGCGGIVQCGTCRTGFKCSEGMCISDGCNTPACICHAQGGEWDGKTCE